MVTRMSGVLRTSDSTGSVASNGCASGQEPGTSSQPSSPQHPSQEVHPHPGRVHFHSVTTSWGEYLVFE
uniref:Uncharacterized protein n=1 Tax=Heterorhabditis bacteriophora TaxID=37862 RepID=A0A1I7XUK8_HETBA